MKTEDLLEKGLTQEQVNFVMQENGKDLKKLQKEVDTLAAERDNFKERAETAETTLKGFDGKSLEEIARERDDWKKKAEDAEKNFNAKEAEREKQELLKEAFAEIEFTSNAAKNAIMSQIAENVTVKNGKLIGFNDLLEDAKKNDASAFVDKEQQNLENNKARFTNPTNKVHQPGKKLGIAELMKLKNENPNLDISQYM